MWIADFTLRVAEKVKKINPKIKPFTMLLHKYGYGEGAGLKNLKVLDHILLLFNFEKKYFDKENIKNTFVGHPLLKIKKILK